MALFGRNKKTEETPTQAASASGQKPVTPAPVQKQAASTINVGGNFAHVLKNPRITEKASMQQEFSVYTFDVASSATKTEIASAVRTVYKVTPRKVRIVAIPSKTTRSMRTGRAGTRAGGKKAYVYLNSGETITIS